MSKPYKHRYEVRKLDYEDGKTVHRIYPNSNSDKERITVTENCNHEDAHTDDCGIIYVGATGHDGTITSFGLSLDAALDLMRAMIATYDEAIKRRGQKK